MQQIISFSLHPSLHDLSPSLSSPLSLSLPRQISSTNLRWFDRRICVRPDVEGDGENRLAPPPRSARFCSGIQSGRPRPILEHTDALAGTILVSRPSNIFVFVLTREAVEFLLSNCPFLERLLLISLSAVGPSMALNILRQKIFHRGWLADFHFKNVLLLVEVSIYKFGVIGVPSADSHANDVPVIFSGCIVPNSLVGFQVYLQNLSLACLASSMKAAPCLHKLVLGYLGFGSNVEMAKIKKASKWPIRTSS
ncbi:hypothetical protein DVH24_029060 [Malus domestica]|uniref:FBD domain-containing protein n=1 Tax=Malus domestica TaxID=3750 RepID=A0A498HUL6_MALDO|nr:hypothetical protein DVH24_029060 [Malus domestica]